MFSGCRRLSAAILLVTKPDRFDRAPRDEGNTRENLSRVFNDWRRRKLVSRLSGYYCHENKALLKAEAEL
jgi:hypothetical protein